MQLLVCFLSSPSTSTSMDFIVKRPFIVHSSDSDPQAACSASRIPGTVLHPAQGQPVLQQAKGIPTLKMYPNIRFSCVFFCLKLFMTDRSIILLPYAGGCVIKSYRREPTLGEQNVVYTTPRTMYGKFYYNNKSNRKPR